MRQQIEDFYWGLTETEEVIPIADEKIMHPFEMAKTLGDTGQLSYLKHIETLNKYGGLNLRKRESRKYKGKLKISKKGRVPLRGILGGMVFKMVRKHHIFGEYYHRRKENEKIPGTKHLANVKCKMLKIIFGMAKRKEQYDQGKFMKCESQHNLAA